MDELMLADAPSAFIGRERHGTTTKVLLLTKYDRLGASSRLRSYQYLPFLQDAGICVDAVPLLSSQYLSGLYSGNRNVRPVITGYLNRIRALVSRANYDLLWIEKEALPWIPAVFERLLVRRVPLLLDYDDAIFHNYDHHSNSIVRTLLKKKIADLMCRADTVTVGSDYLREYAVRNGVSRVEKIPTVVDLSRYKINSTRTNDGPLRVGWIGTPANSSYLLPLLPLLRELVSRRVITVVAVGAPPLAAFAGIVETRPWCEQNEAQELQNMDIGIMPLPDQPFERGKCGYKLIQYMAAGKPVIASPIGENNLIVDHGGTGFLATTPTEWQDALFALCESKSLRSSFGERGRKLVESRYCLDVAAPKLASIIFDTAAKTSRTSESV